MKIATLVLLPVSTGTLLVAQDGSRWAGPYLGDSLGYGWGMADTRFSALPDPVTFGGTLGGTTVKPDPKGLLAGAQFGYNWQSGRLVYDLEADWSWSDMSGEKSVNPIIQNNGTPYPGAGYLAAGQDTRWRAPCADGSPCKEKVFSEIYRVLKPGGELVFSDVFAMGPGAETVKNISLVGCENSIRYYILTNKHKEPSR